MTRELLWFAYKRMKAVFFFFQKEKEPSIRSIINHAINLWERGTL